MIGIAEPLANYHCAVGENPLWDADRQLVYWTDITRGRLFSYDVRTGKHRQFYAGDPVGGFTLQADGSLLLFQKNIISRLTHQGKPEVLLRDIDADMGIFNDVIADPLGRVFAGTYTDSPAKDGKGGLYRIDLDGTITCLFKGTNCSNGMAFSPDHRFFFWTCSSRRRIYRFRYDVATGALSDRREWLAYSPQDPGIPDGMTIDSQGTLWSAVWDGSAIVRYDLEGRRIGQIDFPVAKVSSLTFGGPLMNDLYVTTAGGSAASSSADGTLYRVHVGVQGIPEFRSRICLG